MMDLLLAVWSLVAFAAPARPVIVSGRVVHIVGRDTLPAAQARIILHRVTPETQGPVDSMSSGAGGIFHFRVTPDSGEIYLVSARWGGVEYFSTPLPASALDRDQQIEVFVSDTSTVAPITLVARQLVIAAPARDGTREVIDAFTLANAGLLTRVTRSASDWSWRFVLPPGAVDPHLNDSDFALDAFTLNGDTLLLHAAIPPGKHSILVSYKLPAHARRFTFSASEPALTVTVMAEEHELTATGLIRGESQEIDGKHFTEWSGAPADGVTVIAMPWDGSVPTWLLPVIVVLMASGLLGVGALALRRRERGAMPANVVMPAPRSAAADALLDRLAILDREHGGHDAVRDGRWEAYLVERARLKEELVLALRRPEGERDPPTT